MKSPTQNGMRVGHYVSAPYMQRQCHYREDGTHLSPPTIVLVGVFCKRYTHFVLMISLEFVISNTTQQGDVLLSNNSVTKWQPLGFVGNGNYLDSAYIDERHCYKMAAIGTSYIFLDNNVIKWQPFGHCQDLQRKTNYTRVIRCSNVRVYS